MPKDDEAQSALPRILNTDETAGLFRISAGASKPYVQRRFKSSLSRGSARLSPTTAISPREYCACFPSSKEQEFLDYITSTELEYSEEDLNEAGTRLRRIKCGNRIAA